MDLRKLEIFVAVAESGSFSRAAEQLHLAQPAVSIAVRKLEQQLDNTLLDRSARRVRLTAEGRLLLQRARPILAEIKELSRSLDDMNRLLQGEVDLACPSMMATYFLPRLLTGFLTRHPGLTASIHQAGTTAVEEMLLQGRIELGVTTSRDGRDSGELELTPLLQDEVVLCVSPDHAWAQRESVSVRELHRAPMVIYQSGYFIRHRLDQLCREHDVEPDIRMQSNFLPLLVNMVREGLGISVGLRVMTDREPDIVGVPLQEDSGLHLALARHRDRQLSRANQAFLDWTASTL